MLDDINPPVVKFERVGLRYGFGPEILQDINFSLAPGSFHFLLGESGAGKSSLLKLIYLAFKPSRGAISLFGRDISSIARNDFPSVRRRIGVVFQEFRLLSHLSTYDNVALPLRVAGVREPQVKKHVTELLEWVGLQNHMNSRPPTLSGGQQQRVALARSLVMEPEMLLLDEPFSALDAFTRASLQKDVRSIAKNMGINLVIVTHSIDEAVLMADRAVIMAGSPGKIKEEILVELPEERTAQDPEVQKIRGHLMETFRQASTASH